MQWLNIISDTEAYSAVEATLQKNRAAALFGLHGAHRAAFAAALAQKSGRPIVVVTRDEAEAIRFADDAALMLGGSAAYYPARDLTILDARGVSREAEHGRLSALGLAAAGKLWIMTMSCDGYMAKTMPPRRFASFTRNIKIGDTVSLRELQELLITEGYQRTDTVEGRGAFAVRGGIVDIWPPAETEPHRIELWGDTVDEITAFDPDTQRRTDPKKIVVITPATEVVPPDAVKARELLEKALKSAKNEKYKEIVKRDLDLYMGGASPESCDRYLPLFMAEGGFPEEYLRDPIILFSEPTSVLQRARDLQKSLDGEYEGYRKDGLTEYKSSAFYRQFSLTVDGAALYCDVFARSIPDVALGSVTTVTGSPVPRLQGSFAALTEQVQEQLREGYAMLLYAATQKEADNLCRDLVTAGITATRLTTKTMPIRGTVSVGVGTLSGGFEFPAARLTVLTGCKTGAPKKPRKLSAKAEKNMFGSLEDLHPGDYVVHATHGIGQYQGIQRIDHHGMVKDYIKIAYKGQDVLYLPVTQLNMVSPYMTMDDGAAPKVAKLYSGEWQKTKQTVYRSVREMAKELIALYAKREQAKGIAFPPDDDWQRDFETRFIYEETDDQLRAATEIKKDMQRQRPMDRLLCGDVGVGKTEVAMRAAFKCVNNSCQCAILVPTTILAWQHYGSFLERMEPYPVKVAMLSRFTSAKDMKKAIEGIEKGTVDIVIGTHRLLQKDVIFKNLGLLIIDEEQRFGVAHKEKLKEKFKDIDVLTLSATPIPRTLNMAMSGIRDMSVIEQAPEDRLPISTYVVEYDQGTVDSAIERELSRGGQVYYLHNRTDSIERVAAGIKERFPEATVEVAHGKMSEDQLSKVWKRVTGGETDILVCTTIIETGIDVANANTLIIEDADKLGLAQLYQIRGRVGRSSRRAYAYFTFRGGAELTEIAQKRLSAIRDFTSLGSGFKIAMRDLQIRGAGSVLSARQSGHMAAVGYETYLKILEEAIADETGEERPEKPRECLIDFAESAYIPEKYIRDPASRIAMYKRIAAIENEEEAEDVMDELGDRFGPMPQPACALVDVALARALCTKLGIYEVTCNGPQLTFYIDRPDPIAVAGLVKLSPRRIMFTPKGKSYITASMKPRENPSEAALEVAKDLLQATEGRSASLAKI